ncbi:hypothetical protein FSP39_007686 [Pinctada imbricata]|uniref:LITAF domain-containing protein n=1 Tax=Pinctada imbricata TaxID=66713 RepID=A0AA88Y368_PINIB|nr:hypothetical protein FSP39_007686 [Pinctada imbricata]
MAQPGQPMVITTAQPAGQTIVVAGAQPVPAPIPGPKSFRDTPLRCTCPNCGQVILSNLTYEVGVYTVVVCIILPIIPCFLNGCKDVVHHCPACHHRLGKYVKM